MSARQGWIGEPQPNKEWHESRYSREADRIREASESQRRADEAEALQAWEKRAEAATSLPKDQLWRKYAHLK